jgi:DNA-directed RNA polymerase subunit omega
MEPFLSIDCQRYVPNRFTLVHFLASRVRALNRGAEPRLPQARSNVELAMKETASGAFAAAEAERLMLAQAPADSLPEAVDTSEQELLEGMASRLPSEPLPLGKGI